MATEQIVAALLAYNIVLYSILFVIFAYFTPED